MKLFNFRPLCWLALIVMMAVGVAMISIWLAVAVGVVLCCGLYYVKVPRQFKIVAMIMYGVTLLSYIIHTTFNLSLSQISDVNWGLRGIVLRYVRWYLPMFLSTKNANIIYTMLFGDKSVLSADLYTQFSVTGLAHLLTVSGLHVGLLFKVIEKLLIWCRVPKRAHLWVITPLLLFYADLCGWRYAVMRAVIMCLVYVVAKGHLVVADPLSVLALAATIILVLDPLALESVSFLLSFACVFGIILWYRELERLIPSKAITMYFAVTLGSFPFLIYYFGKVPLLGVVANVVLMPLLVLSFYLGLFAVSTFICGAVLWLVEPLLNFVNWVTSAVGQLSWATLSATHGLVAVFIYYFASLILSRFVFLKPKIKYPLVAVLFSCYLVLLVF